MKYVNNGTTSFKMSHHMKISVVTAFAKLYVSKNMLLNILRLAT